MVVEFRVAIRRRFYDGRDIPRHPLGMGKGQCKTCKISSHPDYSNGRERRLLSEQPKKRERPYLTWLLTDRLGQAARLVTWHDGHHQERLDLQLRIMCRW